MPPLTQARLTAQRVLNMIEDLCTQTCIAGSIRRGKSHPGDAELVVLPRYAPTVLARLDKLVINQRVQKARYIDKNGRASHRWGTKYRGVCIPGSDMKVEIFFADANNWGYQKWLRTGPGDANHYSMYTLLPQSGFQARDGYIWKGDAKICVDDEHTMFDVLRLPWMEPGERTEAAYRRAERLPPFMLYTVADRESDNAPPAQQLSLF